MSDVRLERLFKQRAGASPFGIRLFRFRSPFAIRHSSFLLPLLFGSFSSFASTNIHTSWLWHLHQPIYWPDRRVSGGEHYEAAWDTIQQQDLGRGHPTPEVLRNIFGLDDRINAYQGRPRDALGSITGYLNSGAQVSYSGALMENIQSLGGAGQLGYGASWYSGNRAARSWTTTGGKPRMDLVNFNYHHALAPFLSDRTLELELRIHQRQMEIFWTTNPPLSRGYFPPETCFSERLIPILKKVGITWTIIANSHLARACADFPVVIGSGGENCDLPNRADQLNPAQGSGNYQRISIDRGCAPTQVMPFGFQIHTARYVDPETGAASRLLLVPSDQALGWKDSYSTWDLDLLNPLKANNNSSKPSLALFAHDGDNAWSGGYSYYMEWVNNFTSQAASRGYEPTTVEQFLADFPPDTNDIVHVEDGGWVYADGDFGSPIFINWHWPPSYSSGGVNVVDPSVGVSDKADNWRVIIATENRVKTAEQISGLTNRVDQVRDPGSFSTTPNAVELGWHYYLAGLDSGFVYYGCSGDMCLRTSIAQSNAVRNIDGILAGNPMADSTPPTVFQPQRHPWNPGGTNYGVQYSYKVTVPTNSDFWVWTYAYDVSGITNVSLRFRSDGTNPPTQDEFKTYAGGPDAGPWITSNMTKRAVAPVTGANPQYIADYYYSKVSGIANAYVDYYVTATDALGNTSKSPIQHVYVGAGQGGGSGGTTNSYPPFVMDGVADFPGYLMASNGMTLYAALRGTKLYVATWSPGTTGSNDHFIFVSDQLLPSATANAPWAKSGKVAVASTKPYLASESLNSYIAWYNAPTGTQAFKAPSSSGQMEGTVDLVAAFGSLPANIYLCAAAYQTADGGALAAQAPAGSGPDVDPNEFFVIPTIALRDNNADGKFDRLDPALDFTLLSLQCATNSCALTWSAMPSHGYQVVFSDVLGAAWSNLPGASVTAGSLQLFLSYTDVPPPMATQRFYKIKLLP